MAALESVVRVCVLTVVYTNNMLMNVNIHYMLTNGNKCTGLPDGPIARRYRFATVWCSMPQLLTPALLGRLVREARRAAGLSQTALGERIGASRFWIAEFEQGKLTAELGLALRAVQAVGLTLHVTSPSERAGEADKGKAPASGAGDIPSVDLGAIIAAASGLPSPSPRVRAAGRVP